MWREILVAYTSFKITAQISGVCTLFIVCLFIMRFISFRSVEESVRLVQRGDGGTQVAFFSMHLVLKHLYACCEFNIVPVNLRTRPTERGNVVSVASTEYTT